jgi:hypothetical protein
MSTDDGLNHTDSPPVSCCLSEERGRRLIQIWLQIEHPPLRGFYANLTLDEAKEFAAALTKQISILDRTD